MGKAFDACECTYLRCRCNAGLVAELMQNMTKILLLLRNWHPVVHLMPWQHIHFCNDNAKNCCNCFLFSESLYEQFVHLTIYDNMTFVIIKIPMVLEWKSERISWSQVDEMYRVSIMPWWLLGQIQLWKLCSSQVTGCCCYCLGRIMLTYCCKWSPSRLIERGVGRAEWGVTVTCPLPPPFNCGPG